MTDIQQSITYLPINHLQPNPHQPRASMDPAELQELVQSIKVYGLLEPIVVAQTPAGYQIIAGERRWKASKLAGLTDAPCIIKETSAKGMLEMAIIENVQRVDLHPIDRAKAFRRLMDEFHLTMGQIAERLGKSMSYVSNSIRLLDLPDALKDGLLSGAISEGHARALAAIEDPKFLIEAYKIILKEGGSVRQAEELARRMKAKSRQPFSKGVGRAPFISSEEIDRWQEKMTKYLGDRSEVRLLRSRRQTKVMFILKGSLDRTQHILEKIEQITTLDPLVEPMSEKEKNRITLDHFNSIEISV